MTTISFQIPGTPVPQARSRHRVMKLKSGKVFSAQYDPAESRIWKGVVAEFAARAMAGAAPLEGPIVLEVVFVFLPPASLPRKRMAQLIAATGGEIPKTTKPDLKNLISGCEDGMNGIVFRDDGQVWSYGNSRKIFGPAAETRITVTAVDIQARPAAQPALALA
ncbi:MAG: RusA family crossover junction endodeoxyribonuclease [Candidatus Methylomirabilales bacterium]